MPPYRSSPGMHHKHSTFIFIISALILVGLAGVLSSCGKKTAVPTASPTAVPPTAIPPTPTAQVLPPALVETNPLPGSQVALKKPFTLYFNQPMDHPSVEGALSTEPGITGSFKWQDDATLTFTPDSALAPDTPVMINIATSAKSAKGMQMLQPVSLSYTTSTSLRLVQSLPAADATDVNPTSAVVSAFTQPVVPLGADPASLPAAFTLSPTAEGRGEWINTSTYIFYPDPGLAGGETYQVKVNPDLTSTAGAPLESAQDWSFHTVLPRLVSALPADGTYNVRLDANTQINFSYSMDSTSVEANFSLEDGEGNPVAGQSGWNKDFTTFIFTPTALLKRDATYSVMLGADAAAMGGTRLGETSSLKWYTVPELSISGSEPSQGGEKGSYETVRLFLTSYLDSQKDYKEFFTFTPSVTNLGSWQDEGQLSLNFYGDFLPDTNYTLTVSPDLTDVWGSRLGKTYTLRFRTASLAPSIQLAYSSDTSFLTTKDSGLLAQVTNISSLPLSVGTFTLNDLVQMLGYTGYEFRQNYIPGDAQSWIFYPGTPHNQSTTVTIPLSPSKQPRAPGLYFMRMDVPSEVSYSNTVLLAVSHYQTTLKLSPNEAFVWVIDLDSNSPAAGLPVAVYDQTGVLLASGTTNADGIFQNSISAYQDFYNLSFAVVGQPGEDNFGFAISSWNDGISPWDFDVPVDYYPSSILAYVYTDRPIYRPGDTVHFRAIIRKADNGRYSLPDMGTFPLVLDDSLGNQVARFDLQLSAFATGQGEYTLPSNATPGNFSLTNPDHYAGTYFQVADYRKPEINLQVAFQSTDVLSGTVLTADINARYFFDAPASNMTVQWVLYRKTASFNIPNYQVGPVDTSWLNVYTFHGMMGGLGLVVKEGTGQTDANGLLSLEIPAAASPGRQQYTLEVTLTDESGLPVSARSSMYVNPAKYYIGVHPDAWSFQAKAEAGFSVLVTDWQKNPAGEQTLSAKFQRVVWVRHDPSPNTLGTIFPTYEPVYTLIDSTTLTTSLDGTARVGFTPPEPGTYQLDISGDGTLTQVIVWVGGEGQATWPSLPNQRLRLVADMDKYKPGDTANVFIPNPFSSPALGLMTVERGKVMSYQILHLDPGGSTIPVELSMDSAPNIIIAVTLLGQDEQGNADFRQGYVNLPVDPSFEYLNVALTSQPERTSPGEAVTFTLHITDSSGKPVQGEFSLSVVDLAVLSLADPNSEDILTAFYGQQRLSVRTGISLAASGQRLRYMPGGMGGGGEGAQSVTRENFPDTAYWEAQIVTDVNGDATVSVTLPDSLTTWQVLVRGLTQDTLVGEAQLQVITTQDLVVRPVAPRFLVAGDHAMLAAVVQNNTAESLQGEVTLNATGFQLDDPASATQQVTIQANGRIRVEWWGTAQDVASADMLFSVQAGSRRDAVRLSKGALPVLRYTAPQTFATSGTIAEGGQRLELVSLPVTLDANSGSLDVELDPSLASAMIDALDALENYPYDCTEQALSRFLPNLVTYTTLQTFGIESPDLKARLDRTLKQGLEHLLSLQNTDGGWGWWQGDDSDVYISAYVLYGLARAKAAGITVPPDAINNATSYISSNLITPSEASENWELDRLAFENFALKQAGAGNMASADQLYDVRDQLSPWANALLALSLDVVSSGSMQIPTLISDLQATAIRSATGVHWEAEKQVWRNMTSTLSNSAMVVYTLAQLEPTSTLLPDAMNYLMSNRQASGFWSSSYESAWILLAMDEVMKNTGELNSSYGFSASLNGTEIASGQAGGESQLNPVVTSLPIAKLYPHDPNALVIQREPGTGRLYYTAALSVNLPAADAAPLERGISVSREYFTQGADLKTATPVSITQVGDMLTVRLTIVLNNDAYHFVVEDYIPAGTEILNTSLKTSQLGPEGEAGPLYDPRDPFSQGWGWWLFDPAQIYDDHISWTASYLPAGTYQLTYTLVILQAGEYQVLPAHAWMFYFPEVQGTSAGDLMEIKP